MLLKCRKNRQAVVVFLFCLKFSFFKIGNKKYPKNTDKKKLTIKPNIDFANISMLSLPNNNYT